MATLSKVCLLTVVLLTCVLGVALLEPSGGHSTAVAGNHSNSSPVFSATVSPPSPIPPIPPLTPTETPAPTATPTSTAAPTPTATPPPTAAPSPTATPTPTQTPSPTLTASPTAAPTPADPAPAPSTEEPATTPTPTPAPLQLSAPEDTDIEIVDTSISPDWVRAGYTSTVRVTLHNPWRRANLTIRVAHAGNRITTHNVTVPSAATVDRTFEVTFEKPRSGVLAVNDVSAGELTVATADDDSTTTPTEVDDQPGFGPFVALFALLLGVLAARVSMRG